MKNWLKNMNEWPGRLMQELPPFTQDKHEGQALPVALLLSM